MVISQKGQQELYLYAGAVIPALSRLLHEPFAAHELIEGEIRSIVKTSHEEGIIEKEEVPADTLPVRCLTALVATIPVPASPSGGHIGIPACKWPEGSRRCAPSTVNTPASSPATNTFGKMSRR